MDINQCYILCQTVTNKTQNGNLSPLQFNNLAPIAQLSVINQLLGNEQEYRPTLELPKYGFRSSQKISEDLRPLVAPPSTIALSGGSGTYPATSLYLDTVTEASSGALIRPVEYDEAVILNGSVVRPPIVGKAIYYVLGTTINVLPATIASIKVSFVAIPTDPIWNYTTANQAPIYSASGSQDFQLGPLLHLRICHRILQYFGLNLSLEQITQFAMSAEAQGQ